MSVREKVIAILAEQAVLEPSDVEPQHSLADLGIDSRGLVDSPTESQFDISSVDSIVAAVERLIAEQKG